MDCNHNLLKVIIFSSRREALRREVQSATRDDVLLALAYFQRAIAIGPGTWEAVYPQVGSVIPAWSGSCSPTQLYRAKRGRDGQAGFIDGTDPAS
jgi:hypothetical protein